MKQTAIKLKIFPPASVVPNVDRTIDLTVNEKEKIDDSGIQKGNVLKEKVSSHPALSEDGQKKFSVHIADSISNSYCDSVTFGILLRYGKSLLGVDVRRVESILSLALQRLNVINEKELLDELGALLHAFTDLEKKLDKKSRVDALQSVCKARLGAIRGVDPEIAERYIDDFCRKNGVMQRSGMWGWKIL
jgi:DNA gyrase/topoisomerase IV subunit A